MSNEIKLFQEDLIFMEDFKSIDEAFEKMSERFLARDLVRGGYLKSIKERESQYPTGIDLSVIGANFPNVAVPHTESEYCHATRVILVKLSNEIVVKNMMDPEQDLQVKYLFMILNGVGEAQSNILANIMEFVTKEESIRSLEESQTIEELYEVVKNINI